MVEDMSREFIIELLSNINKISSKFILRGGTALMIGYGLDRFSDNIELDGLSLEFFDTLDKSIKRMNKQGWDISYRIVKDTDSIKKVIVHCYTDGLTLKVNVLCSYVYAPFGKMVYISKGILAYNIDSLVRLKLGEYYQYRKARDLYDVLFVYSNYRDVLYDRSVDHFKFLIKREGINNIIDMTLEDIDDDSVDKAILENRFIEICNS